MHSTSWGTEAETLGSLMMFPSGVCTNPSHSRHILYYLLFLLWQFESRARQASKFHRQRFRVNPTNEVTDFSHALQGKLSQVLVLCRIRNRVTKILGVGSKLCSIRIRNVMSPFLGQISQSGQLVSNPLLWLQPGGKRILLACVTTTAFRGPLTAFRGLPSAFCWLTTTFRWPTSAFSGSSIVFRRPPTALGSNPPHPGDLSFRHPHNISFSFKQREDEKKYPLCVCV